MAGLTHLAQTARRRPKPSGDEEATSNLKLGEMSSSAALSTAAAHELLTRIEEARAQDPKLPLTYNDLINKNNAYLATFARFKGSETVQQVTSEAETLTQLAEFERAQLAEEARTLIPSLEGKISDDDLQAVLDNISKLRDFS
ncbi:hypothetical protein Q7P35_007338 [Cladosporium inversicolor]